jgi:hypothetical protein
VKITVKKLKLIIENYLNEEDEPASDPSEEPAEEEEELPVEDEEDPGADEEVEKKEAMEKKAESIASDAARDIKEKGLQAALDNVGDSIKHESEDFIMNISQIPDLIDIFGKKEISKNDILALEKNPQNRIKRSQETMNKRGDKKGGFA